jgi:hypothetical protein
MYFTYPYFVCGGCAKLPEFRKITGTEVKKRWKLCVADLTGLTKIDYYNEFNTLCHSYREIEVIERSKNKYGEKFDKMRSDYENRSKRAKQAVVNKRARIAKEQDERRNQLDEALETQGINAWDSRYYTSKLSQDFVEGKVGLTETVEQIKKKLILYEELDTETRWRRRIEQLNVRLGAEHYVEQLLQFQDELYSAYLEGRDLSCYD